MLVKNEAPWIAAHILNILPFIDEMVFFDGNSTDGTLEIIEAIQKGQHGSKIQLFRDQDPKDLRGDYERMFNEAMRCLSTDLALFIHPDMVLTNPEQILFLKDSSAIALSTKMRSFAGEPGGQLYELSGRGETWKNIHRLRNPDLGAHYHGWYGAWNEDVYFRDITGDDHTLYADLNRYPFEVKDSGLEILHFSDVRSYERRLSRMRTCFKNQGKEGEFVGLEAEHPRVTLKDGGIYKFTPAEYPAKFLEDRAKYAHLERTLLDSHA